MQRVPVLILLLAVLTGGCDRGSYPTDDTGEEMDVLETIDLPPPSLEGPISVDEALSARRSVREFTSEELTTAEIAQLLWAGQGINRDSGGRTNPSAGGLYPLELYLLSVDGMLHYSPEGHRAEVVSTVDLRADLQRVALDQEAVGEAPAVLVICGVYSRTETRYGSRAERYVHLEAGHVAQSMLLQAVALDLGGVPIGAFDDAGVQRVLDLPSSHQPLYLIPIGHPAE